MSRLTTTLPAPAPPARISTRPSDEDIALRAHQIFIERGSAPGLDLDDWLQAERELTAAAAAATAAPVAPKPKTPAPPQMLSRPLR